MIQYQTGDVCEALRKGEIDVLIHGCNAQGVMGSGIAKQIKEQFPLAYTIYKRQERHYGLSLSNFSTAKIEDNKFIVNLITQDQYLPRGVCHLDYDALELGLKEIDKLFHCGKIGMPKIGAGLAGGDWEKIEGIINEVFKERTIYVYELGKST
jgi:O-acetyl-ADP-ribose deacetylase (regulator of RNase III)